MNKIVLTGGDLRIEDICNLQTEKELMVEISPESLANIRESRKFVDANLTAQIIYGINTGFGPMASHIVGKNDLVDLQRNLVFSHAVGVGKPIDQDMVRAAMVVRLNTLVKGFSGASEDLLSRIVEYINHKIIPVVPEHGAVGTCGDLIQLAHIAFALIGEGDVFYKGERMGTSEALKKADLPLTYQLKPKEGLALMNGTAAMTGISALLSMRAERLVMLSIHTGAMALELVNAFEDGYSEKLQSVRPHPGQIYVAEQLREILSTSKLTKPRELLSKKVPIKETGFEIPESVQEVYSLRCIPQIVGPIWDTLQRTMMTVTTEINSVTDNPIVDMENNAFIHGGNFHGDYISMSIDFLKIVMVKLTMLSERRINYFLNKNTNKHFPPFLNLTELGITLGLQGMQFVATSTTAQNQTLAFPQYIHSIPTNGDNQDIVSMGTDAALLTAKVIENAFIVLALEVVTLAQAVDISKVEDQMSKKTQQLYRNVRKIISPVTDQKNIAGELEALVAYLKETDIDEI